MLMIFMLSFKPILDAQGQTVVGDKSGKFQNCPTIAENSKVI